MQQRVQIARSLAQKPQVLLMDEPFGALDAMTRQGLQDELQRLMMKHRMTVFFVTHDLEEAIYLADRVVALRRNPGRIGKVFEVKIARPRDQVATPEDPEFLRIRRELYDFIKDAELEPSA
jgi:NitT/TauT family transport system ATP-binding protein